MWSRPSDTSNGHFAVLGGFLFARVVVWILATDRPFQFQKRGQFLISMHNEALSVIAVRVSNPDCSPFGVNG